MKRKLIEVSLPLEVINRESAREKSIRHGHPSTLHLWWARRPLAAARAVLFAQLVDDPSCREDEFREEARQRQYAPSQIDAYVERRVSEERDRLHRLIERLVVWENVRDESLLAEAHAEILKSTDGNPPPILDPFCGGGTIPLEAQRLGLEAHASDLNPVAVLITKALVEIPPKFRDGRPVFPGLADSEIRTWRGAEGLAADVRAYGQWMRDEAAKRIGHVYPKATLPGGSKATVIAWIWARTVTCPNPACRIEMPLVRSWWLGKKKGKEAYVVPTVIDNPGTPSGKRIAFDIGHDPRNAPTTDTDGTVGRTGAVCVACETAVELKYIRLEGQGRRMGARLIATVAEGNRQRIYLGPTPEHERAAQIDRPADVPDGDLPKNPRDFKTPNYGMSHWADLFTARQLVALTTFSDLVREARDRVLADSLAAGIPEGDSLEAIGTGATAYADAVVTYLGMALSRTLNKSTAICSWDSSSKMEAVRGLFARQAIPMAWDFAEANILGTSSGNFPEDVQWVTRALVRVPSDGAGVVKQGDASVSAYDGSLISTDPPYYDNIGYSDLSDFFYVWLRRSLHDVYPDLLSTLLVPKREELVANPYRHDGKEGAKKFFEEGFRDVFARARAGARDEYPITVYYAFKQSESSIDGTASTGWETLLEAMVQSGWEVTGTWPMRSELGNRMLASGTNALASSIVLALRPRPADVPTTDRRGFLAALRAELPTRLRELQEGAIAPVDLPQAAIGPGMTVFTRYAKVIESDGSPMRVRSALFRIRDVLDEVLNEQEGDFDPTTRFAITWFRQHGYATGKFGDTDNMARAYNTSVEDLDRDGVLVSRAGKVTLIRPADLPSAYDPLVDPRTSTWEVVHHLIRVLDADGIDAAGRFLAFVEQRPDAATYTSLAKELAYLLFSVADSNKLTKEAIAFNNLATSWNDIVAASRNPQAAAPDILEFPDEEA